MPRTAKKKKPIVSSAKASKYDAHHAVINNTYGDFADLRHQLSESKEDVAERAKLLQIFSACNDSQRSWLLLEDYFNKLNLARKDFSQDDWWGGMAKSSGDVRPRGLGAGVHEVGALGAQRVDVVRQLHALCRGGAG